METKKKVLYLALTLILLLVVFYTVTKAITEFAGYAIRDVNEDAELDEFAKCLTENNVKMYGSTYCGYCKKQKDLFGESFQYITYIECTETPDLCDNLQGVPAWETANQLVYGLQTLDKLEGLSSCKLN